MLPNLHENKAEFQYAILETANYYGIDSAMVEKDYWITWCLNYLFDCSQWKGAIGFKGGTCMAKSYGVIDRFSEDIDILLDWRLLGYKTNEPLEPVSNNKKNEMKKDMNKKTIAFLSDTMLPTLQNEINEKLGSAFEVYIDKTDLMSIQFKYPNLFAYNPSILSTVKLEIGPMSQWSQLTLRPVTSMIDTAFPSAEIFAPLPILSVSPERTFWDKISILQNVSHWQDKDSTRPLHSRYSRHYYDVYCILNSEHQKPCLEQANLFYEVMDFSSRFYPVTTFDYQTVTLSNLRLDISNNLMKELKEDYARMQGMIYGNVPSFDEIYQRILGFQEQIHSAGLHNIVNKKDSLENKIQSAATRNGYSTSTDGIKQKTKDIER